MNLEQFSALFNVVGIGLVLLVSLVVRQKYESRFFACWTQGYAGSFALLALDLIRTFRPDQPGLTLVTSAFAAAAAWFYIQTAQILKGRPLSWRWGAGLFAGGLGMSLVCLLVTRSALFAIVPAALLYSFSGVWLGAGLIKRSTNAVVGRHWVGWPLIAVALWSYTYPIFQGTSYFWVGYFVSGLLQILVGLGMALFLLEQVARQLEVQNAKLQQLDELKMNFLSTVSHELRTPLTCIVGYLELMDDGLGGELSDQQKVFVDGMRRGSQQLGELVNALLDSVQIEKGQLKVECAPFSLPETLTGTLTTLRSLSDKKGIRLVQALPDGLPRVVGDARRTDQVLTNLVGNAIKFTPEGGTIRVDARIDGEMLAVEVADSGPGIPPDKLAQIFEPFFQADNSLTRQHGGTGLGLPIARSLVEAMGGQLAASSREGEGSVFRFTLPIDRGGVAMRADQTATQPV